MEWRPINPFGEFEAKGHNEFLIKGECGNVYVGFNVFDYYDSKYWCPMPKMPMAAPVITNDACIVGLLKDR